MAYIYKVTNLTNQKIYVGQTKRDPEVRWKEHIAEANRGSDRAFHKALRKYGVENFSFEVLEWTDDPDFREKFYIKHFNSFHYGYNETLGGEGKTTRILPEQDICRDYLQGIKVKELAERNGCCVDLIYDVLHKYNIHLKTTQEIHQEQHSKPIARLDPKTEEILETFPSYRAAERSWPSGNHIAQVANGKRKTAAGFKWKWL